ncbi:hypothetical protein GQ53DRAFT_852763 [Thozetella sp. PMI_491]|nr:hypothetical protein GQ53DRAFT_852763 [Thozetella sp. PMI_491]
MGVGGGVAFSLDLAGLSRSSASAGNPSSENSPTTRKVARRWRLRGGGCWTRRGSVAFPSGQVLAGRRGPRGRGSGPHASPSHLLYPKQGASCKTAGQYDTRELRTDEASVSLCPRYGRSLGLAQA